MQFCINNNWCLKLHSQHLRRLKTYIALNILAHVPCIGFRITLKQIIIKIPENKTISDEIKELVHGLNNKHIIPQSYWHQFLNLNIIWQLLLSYNWLIVYKFLILLNNCWLNNWNILNLIILRIKTFLNILYIFNLDQLFLRSFNLLYLRNRWNLNLLYLII